MVLGSEAESGFSFLSKRQLLGCLMRSNVAEAIYEPRIGFRVLLLILDTRM